MKLRLHDPFLVDLLGYGIAGWQPPPISKRRNPLDLPLSPSQCVHVDVKEGVEGFVYARCPSTIHLGRHGYLCPRHHDFYGKGVFRGRVQGDEFEELIVRMNREVWGCKTPAIDYTNHLHLSKDDDPRDLWEKYVEDGEDL